MKAVLGSFPDDIRAGELSQYFLSIKNWSLPFKVLVEEKPPKTLVPFKVGPTVNYIPPLQVV